MLRSTRTMLAGLLLVAATAIVVIVITRSPTPGSGEFSDASVVSHLRARYEASGGSRPFDSLDDLLDNVRFSMPNRATRPLTDAVVVGRVSEVSRGVGFYGDGDDKVLGVRSDFDDPRVEWRTVHLTVTVERTLSGSNDDPVTVGVAFGDSISFERIEDDLLESGRLLLFLQKDQPLFEYDPDIYGTILDGALLGLVDPDGSISLPVLEGNGAEAMLEGTPSIDALARATQAKPRLIRLDASGVVVGEQLD